MRFKITKKINDDIKSYSNKNLSTSINQPSEKPWGQYIVLATSNNYQVKEITINPFQRLSYQTHNFRSEHWFIVAGEALATIEGRDIILSPGDSIDIPIGQAHRIGARDTIVKFIEVQTGTYFGEDDIVRLSDDYQRGKV